MEDRNITEVPTVIVDPPVSYPPTPPLLLFLSTSFTALWGTWFLLPWDTFSSSPTFSLMQQMAPEWAWGLLFLIIGGWKLFEVVRLIQTSKIRLRDVFVNFLIFVLWSTVATAFMMSDPRSTGFLTYGFFAVLSIFSTAESWAAYNFRKQREER